MLKRILPIAFTFLLILGFASGYLLRIPNISFIMYHIGGFGALGILSCIVGSIASKKGYGYLTPLLFSLVCSSLIGIVSAYLVPPSGNEGRPAACGGSVSLAVAVIFIIVWIVAKNKNKAESPYAAGDRS